MTNVEFLRERKLYFYEHIAKITEKSYQTALKNYTDFSDIREKGENRPDYD